jgi:nitrate/TMAO reductase-like tetraheme cytochrome c subunit
MTPGGIPPVSDGGRRRWGERARRLLFGLAGVSVLIACGLALTVSRLEESDSFCVACHTAPEVAYFNRAQAALTGADARDLASAHYGLVRTGVRCIDCHRGDNGAAHRATTLALGARDAAIFVSGRADPVLEKARASILAPDLLDAACARCHATTLLLAGFDNHFHNKLPAASAAWRAGGELSNPPGDSQVEARALKPSTTSVSCVDCHPGHVTAEFGGQTMYLDLRGVVFPACGQCHVEVGHGPSTADLLGP